MSQSGTADDRLTSEARRQLMTAAHLCGLIREQMGRARDGEFMGPRGFALMARFAAEAGAACETALAPPDEQKVHVWEPIGASK